VLAALLGIRTLIVAVNKMDLVNWSEAAFNSVRDAFEKIRPELAVAGNPEITYVPVSALKGDNIVNRSTSAPWYTGPALLDLLESAPTHAIDATGPARFPVQCVIRPRTKASDGHDFRGYAGMVASGVFKVGDRVVAASTGKSSTIESIHLHDRTLTEARPPQSVTLTLTDDIDIGRGEMLVRENDVPSQLREFSATLVWMSQTALATGRKYLLRHSTHFTPAVVSSIESRLDVHTLGYTPTSDARQLDCNDIARVTIRTASPLLADPYRRCRATGSFVLIDEASGDTVGAGMIADTANSAESHA
jgi:sulfate adenylyltransferase subunit 1 (EFTu-like GTPase family)